MQPPRKDKKKAVDEVWTPARVRSFLALRSETRETAERRQQKPRGKR